MTEFVAKVTVVGDSVGVIIPRHILEKSNIKRGDVIKIKIVEVMRL